MGMKMLDAFYKKENENISIERAVEESIREDLFCSSKGCRIPLIPVRSFKRVSSVVSAHFRRKEKMEHNEKCKYNTLGQLNIIARESDDLITSLENKKYSFRLNLISTALSSEASVKNDISEDIDSTTIGKKTRNYMPSGKISSYLSTMHKIMELRSRLEDNKELSDSVILQMNGKDIKWRNFYFNPDEYKRCYINLMQNSLNYPICIEGEIKSFDPPKENFCHYSIKLKHPFNERDSDGIKRIPAVSITIHNEALYRRLENEHKKGKILLSFCSSMRAKLGKYPRTNAEYLNINGDVYNEKQIYIY